MVEQNPDSLEQAIAESCRFTYSRSGGPGGQNVNKVNTRATVLFDVAACAILTDNQKAQVLDRLSTRTGRDGLIRVTSQRHRTQMRNREAALARLVELVRDALTDAPPRTQTKKPRSADRRRLDAKRRRSGLKRLRGPVDEE